jgi:hypothetical protein
MLLLLTVALTVALLIALVVRAPSTFLFDLIESVFSHEHPVRRR